MPDFSSNEFSAHLHAAQKAAKLAGTLLMEKMGSAQVWEKGPGDWVTAADFAAQELIKQALANEFPRIEFLGEEDSQTKGNGCPGLKAAGKEQDVGNCQSMGTSVSLSDSIQVLSGNSSHLDHASQLGQLSWIVDPLDGTVNFIHQLPSFSVSIGLVESSASCAPVSPEQILVGVVYDPMLDECFTAVKQQGATLNGNPIHASGCSTLETALTVFSIGRKSSVDDGDIRRMLNVMQSPASLRRLGSAALNLSYVAAGRIDAYWASNLKPWDIAAGWLIAKEAGGMLRGLEQRPLDVMNPNFCCAATWELWNQLSPLLDVSETE